MPENTQHTSTQTDPIENAITQVMAQSRIPRATYRLQFNAEYTFNDAKSIVGYLGDLGISDIYASPLFLPRMGSTHGYDVADPTRLNSDLGSEADLDALTNALHKRGMGLVLDIVPNHMGINDARNGWWLDVLENGPSSEYAPFFDIQWHPIKQEMENKVLLPILGDQYGVILERGELQLNYHAGSFYLTYWETLLPLSPRSYMNILQVALEKMPAIEVDPAETDLMESDEAARESATSEAGVPLPPASRTTVSPGNLARMELESILTALNYLPDRTTTGPERLAERVREKEIVKRRLDNLYQENDQFRGALDAAVEQLNGTVGEPASFDQLDALIDRQTYRLAFWRVAGEEINYRRFFDINELAAIRVEEEQVFRATHTLALRLLAEGKANGLRIDHPDGLYDPVAYFRRLQEYYLALKVRRALDKGDKSQEDAEAERDEQKIHAAVNAWLDAQAQSNTRPQWPLYVVAEKILSESEPLPLDWAVHGTTGYDFLSSANGIFVEPRNEKAFTRIYSRFTRNRTPLRELTFATKMMIMRDSLAGEIMTLAHELERIGEGNRHYRDFTLDGIRTALREVISSLTIYRTYINAHQGLRALAQNGPSNTPENDPQIGDGSGTSNDPGTSTSNGIGQQQPAELAMLEPVPDRDRLFIEAAVREAKRRHPLLDDTLFDYIRDTLLLHNMGKFREEDRVRIAEWVMKFQQLTGPVMAKGVEDTAFYRYNRLVSLNEVGDHPDQFGISVAQFHRANRHRARLWPHAMLATSTHDNKRSEDVRARINVLSSLTDEWQGALRQWSRLNASKTRDLEGETAPDANDEYLFYQTLLGTWPIADPALEQAVSPWGFLLQPGESEAYATFRARISDYMLKAAKEAKVYTSWLNPWEEYEEALLRFVDRVLQPGTRNRFLINLAPLARSVAYFGHFNSLAQTLLKLTAPGVPDIYQGNEMWDFSLVDPDNRRPVDYDLRRKLLKEVQSGAKRKGRGRVRFVQELMQHWQDGRIKLFVTHRALHFRSQHEALFTFGDYTPLETTGARAQHLCAYLRHDGNGAQAIVVVPRLVATLTERTERPPVGEMVWGDTQIIVPEAFATAYAEKNGANPIHNVFTGERLTLAAHGKGFALAAAEVLGNFPVALLAPGE